MVKSERGSLTDATINQLKSHEGGAICQVAGYLKNTKSSFLASLFHIASEKDNMYHYRYSPAGSNCWCKYNADRTNNIQTCKPGPGLPKNIIYKIRSKFGINKRH